MYITCVSHSKLEHSRLFQNAFSTFCQFILESINSVEEQHNNAYQQLDNLVL